MSYEFRESDAWELARFLGAHRQKGRELFFAECPYCHGDGHDRETFSISLDTGKYKCFRAKCGAQGNMITLARDFDYRLSGMEEAPRKVYRRFGTPKVPIEPKPAAVRYLEGRGISAEVAKRYEITVQKDRENILVFPFYDARGEMRFVKYRKTDFDKTRDKAKEWSEKGGMPILFGMKQCDQSEKRLVLTEGQIDSLSCAEAGIKNAVSVPNGAKGFTWVPNCWEFLKGFEEIVVFGDCEGGKITLLDEISRRFGGRVRHVRIADYLGCKDANEILQKHGREAIRHCVDNAAFPPVDCVVEVADVEPVNPSSVEKMKTGIADLDECLGGGLPFGYYHIITGRRGEGKSTLASQLLAEALDQGYGVFAYSGELPVGHFKAWVDFQIAGARKIREGKDGGYFISKYDRERIADWYRGRFFAYDTEKLSDSKLSIIEIAELVVKRNGVRVILIDNLMTAVDLDANAKANKYDAQGEFAKGLAELARRHNVLILLVAHKRKMQAGDFFGNDPNDDISGSSYVTNLAGDIVGYTRPERKLVDKGIATIDDRVLTVTKNRLFGKVNYEGWIMNFEPKSKRIGNARDSLYRNFGWEMNSDGFMDVAEDDDNPFR